MASTVSRGLRRIIAIQTVAFSALLVGLVLHCVPVLAQSTEMQGTVERIKVHGKSLEGNLSGDSPDRDVSIYLPPSYNSALERRFPVVYLLHGFVTMDLSWYGDPEGSVYVPGAADRAINNGSAREMIIVTPNAMTIYGGSNYSSGVTTGDWETFISKELVDYVDTHYRTIADPTSRGLVGHSMGGYGTMRIGMKHPDVFTSLYFMSPCCINPDGNIPDTPEKIQAMESFNTRPEKYQDVPQSIRTSVAAAVAWAPNPKNPPLYYDPPFKNGERQEMVIARMTANRPLAMLDQYISTFKAQNIAFDVGDKDFGLANLEYLHEALTNYGIPHEFQVYDGNHTNRIQERITEHVITFFSEQLAF